MVGSRTLPRTAVSRVLAAFLLLAAWACAPRVEIRELGGLTAHAPPVRAAPPAAFATDGAAVDLHFRRSRRLTQALVGSRYEIRAIYTEAVVRSAAHGVDFHVGLAARPGSRTGYRLNVPPPGSPAPAGVPRLRYLQPPEGDDPLLPSLSDVNVSINPVADGGIYFLGQGIVRTARAGGFGQPVADVFAPGAAAVPVGSVADEQSLRLPMAAAEIAFNRLWESVHYTARGATFSVAPVVVDRQLTDNVTLTTTRFYKWTVPFEAESLALGGDVPLGRLILDVRVIGADGLPVASSMAQRVLQPGSNTFTFTLKSDEQGHADLVGSLPGFVLPLVDNGAWIFVYGANEPIIPGDALTIQITVFGPGIYTHRFRVTTVAEPGDTIASLGNRALDHLVTSTSFYVSDGGYTVQAGFPWDHEFEAVRRGANADIQIRVKLQYAVGSDVSTVVSSSVIADSAPISGTEPTIASGSATLTGSVRPGDRLTLSFINRDAHAYAATATTLAGDDLAAAAARLAAALGGTVSTDGTGTAFGDEYVATAEGAVVSIAAKAPRRELDASRALLAFAVDGLAGLRAASVFNSKRSGPTPASLLQEFTGAVRPGDVAAVSFVAFGSSYQASYEAVPGETVASFLANLSEAINDAQDDYLAEPAGPSHLRIMALAAQDYWNIPDGTRFTTTRNPSPTGATVANLGGGFDGPGHALGAGTVRLETVGADSAHQGQQATVAFTSAAGHAYQAIYTLRPGDIGASKAATLAVFAARLAALLESSASQLGRPFREDYRAMANAGAPGAITVTALRPDAALESAPGGPLAVTRLAPISFTTTGAVDASGID